MKYLKRFNESIIREYDPRSETTYVIDTTKTPKKGDKIIDCDGDVLDFDDRDNNYKIVGVVIEEIPDQSKKFNENLSNDKYELIGNSIDQVLDAINSLKYRYGKDKIDIVDNSGHQSGDKVGVYINFDDNIKLSSQSNIIREINYFLNKEEVDVKIYKV